jgi:hypothetical protein
VKKQIFIKKQNMNKFKDLDSLFLRSYKQTLGSMSHDSFTGINEMVLFNNNKPWFDFLINIINNTTPIDIAKNNLLLNPSISRSMYVMSLFIYKFSGTMDDSILKKIKEYYYNLIYILYQDDMFSIKKNTPLKYKDVYDNILTGAGQCDQTVLFDLYQLCYENSEDIFADNIYEVCGPYSKNGVYYFINNFKFNKTQYTVLNYSTVIRDGVLDLFGHNSYQLIDKKSILLKDGLAINNFDINEVEVRGDEFFIKNKYNRSVDLFFDRYEHIIKFYNIEYNRNDFYEKENGEFLYDSLYEVLNGKG